MRKVNIFCYYSRAIGLSVTSLRATVLGKGTSGIRFKLTGWDSAIQLSTTEPDQAWIINNLHCSENELWLVDMTKQGDQVCIVSDGSFHSEIKMGTKDWMINSSSDHRYHLLGDNITLGASETQ